MVIGWFPLGGGRGRLDMIVEDNIDFSSIWMPARVDVGISRVPRCPCMVGAVLPEIDLP